LSIQSNGIFSGKFKSVLSDEVGNKYEILERRGSIFKCFFGVKRNNRHSHSFFCLNNFLFEVCLHFEKKICSRPIKYALKKIRMKKNQTLLIKMVQFFKK